MELGTRSLHRWVLAGLLLSQQCQADREHWKQATFEVDDAQAARSVFEVDAARALGFLQIAVEPAAATAAWPSPAVLEGTTNLASQGRRSTSEQDKRIEAAKPVYWLHVPKCSTTFFNTLVQHPKLCPGAGSQDYICADCIDDVFGNFESSHNFSQMCPNAFFQPEYLGLHKGIGLRYGDLNLKGHLMTVLRQPKARLISAYNFGMHSWPYVERDGISLHNYVDVARGHFLKMLVRDYEKGWNHNDRIQFFTDPSLDEIHEAHKRLDEGFAFVGITEEWKLSMCLFHTMFGGKCKAAEFWTTHADPQQDKTKQQQEEDLRFFEDPFDGPLYQKALERFHADLEKYSVSEEHCHQCFAEAGVLE